VLSTSYPQATSQLSEWFLIETCKIVTATSGLALSMLKVLPQSQTCFISVLILGRSNLHWRHEYGNAYF
jgi:hypothetical protein